MLWSDLPLSRSFEPHTGCQKGLSWFNLAADSEDHTATHSLLPLQWDGEENGQKVKLVG